MSTDAVLGLLEKYISIWNETDDEARRAIIAEVFTSDGLYVDPNTSAEGHDAIDQYVAGEQKNFNGLVFALGRVLSHHDTAHFAWSFGPAGAAPVASGLDVVVLEDGRINKLYGFFG